jgi:hypothetical protein
LTQRVEASRNFWGFLSKRISNICDWLLDSRDLGVSIPCGNQPGFAFILILTCSIFIASGVLFYYVWNQNAKVNDNIRKFVL